MSEIEESKGCVYKDLEGVDASDMQNKARHVTRLAALIETAPMSKADVAQRLGLNPENLEEILRGKFRDINVSTLVSYGDLMSENNLEK